MLHASSGKQLASSKLQAASSELQAASYHPEPCAGCPWYCSQVDLHYLNPVSILIL